MNSLRIKVLYQTWNRLEKSSMVSSEFLVPFTLKIIWEFLKPR